MAASFQYIKRLGSGFFGEVWLVKDLGLDSIFALKLIPPSKVLNSDNFYQEAQTLKAVENPNVVQVFETGEMADGKIYVKMEYLKHGSLEDEASGNYVPLTRAKKLMVDVLRGLEFAHSKSIVHRDIKPGNIMIGDSREGKLSDFGMALPDIKKINLSSLKEYQYWMHLAPEVDKLSDYDHLSDIYSCGMTLYRMVNGDIFLPSTLFTDIRAKIKGGKFPDRSAYREFIPNALRRVINKALNVDPAKRYQSATEMRRALEQVPLGINWIENQKTNSIRFRSSHNGTVLQVKRLQNADSTCSVETKKGKSVSTLRKVNKFCKENVTIKEAEKFTKQILQDFVTGKEK